MAYVRTKPGCIGVRHINWAASLVLAMAVLIGSMPQATAEELGDTDAGHRLAQTWCSNCHVIDREQQRGSSTGAPTFTAIAATTATTRMGLRAFLQTPHDRMPDLHLSRNETDDLIAYILSLRPQPAR